MYNETVVSVRGWTGAKPRVFDNANGGRTVVFPVGVTPRVLNRATGAYEDGRTIWYDVRCYGRLAANVSASIGVGAPVMVRGALVLRERTDREGVAHRSFTIVADAVGIDLNTVSASFRKSFGPGDAVDGEPPSAASNLSGAQAGVADTPGGTPGHEHAAGTMPGSEVEFVGDGTGTYESVRMPSADNAAESCEDEAQGAQAAELAGLSV